MIYLVQTDSSNPVMIGEIHLREIIQAIGGSPPEQDVCVFGLGLWKEQVQEMQEAGILT